MSKPTQEKPAVVKDLESFAHRYPVDKIVHGKPVKVPDPGVLADAERLEQFISNRAKKPHADCSTW